MDQGALVCLERLKILLSILLKLIIVPGIGSILWLVVMMLYKTRN